MFNQLEKLQQQQKVSRAVQTMICRDILRRNMVVGMFDFHDDDDLDDDIHDVGYDDVDDVHDGAMIKVRR